MKLKVINLFAGPGAGKSTTRAGLFYKLKSNGIRVEEVTEFAKDLTWERAFDKRNDQLSVFAEQHWRLKRLEGQVDIVLTDSPLLLSKVYRPSSYLPSMDTLVDQAFQQFDNYNFYIERTKPYVAVGRDQNELEAWQLDYRIGEMLIQSGIKYSVVKGDNTCVDAILQELKGIGGVA